MKSILQTFLMALVFLFSMSLTTEAAVAQDLTAYADFTNQPDGDCEFRDSGTAGVTTGDFVGPGDDITDWAGWTWEKVENNFRVYTPGGEVAMTFVGAANSGNKSGAITDGPSAGDYGGNWRR